MHNNADPATYLHCFPRGAARVETSQRLVKRVLRGYFGHLLCKNTAHVSGLRCFRNDPGSTTGYGFPGRSFGTVYCGGIADYFVVKRQFVPFE